MLVLTYPDDDLSMLFLFDGSWLCAPASSGPPGGDDLAFGTYMLYPVLPTVAGFSHRGLASR